MIHDDHSPCIVVAIASSLQSPLPYAVCPILFALDFSSLLAALAGHGLLQRMHCGDHSIYLDLLIEHFLTGMCTALKGPSCKSTVQGCHRVCVRPLVFMTTCIYRSGVLDRVLSTNLLPFWHFLAWGSPEHKHDCTIDALK